MIRPFIFIFLLMGLQIPSWAQQQITVEISPTISRAIDGKLDLNRARYFNLATAPSEINRDLDSARFAYYLRDLGMTVGRNFQIISGESRWGNGFREDPARPGWMDTTFLKNAKNPNNQGMDEMIQIWGSKAGIAAHDGHDAYPDFIEKYTIPDAGNDAFPVNNDAAAEMIAYYLKYGFTDFQRPWTYELVNEPHWKYWGDSRFVQHHVKAVRKVRQMGVDVEIGGPCLSVGNFFKKNYESLPQMTNFMAGTNYEMDFYSFHIYDYMRWDPAEFDFVGAISSGLPEEGVFDALNAFHVRQTGKNMTYVGSEHGGYLTNGQNRQQALDTLADLYFPGSGFQHEMEKRSIDNFIMVNSAIANTLTFMNHPHVVKKAVPFILLESSRWDPAYYSSLLVKEDFDKNNPTYHESRLIHFFEYFKDVQGRRVLSTIDDTDIQHFAFRSDSSLILLFHNQSNTDGIIDIALKDYAETPQSIMVRRLGRQQDFRPYLTESPLASLDDALAIGGQESIALFVHFGDSIPEDQILNEKIFASQETGVKFSGSRNFTVDVEEDNPQYALLRVGISRASGLPKAVEIRLNGQLLPSPVEDCADRLTADDYYATTKIVHVDKSLIQASNTVQVSFPDGGEGGVGAVVMRVGTDAPFVTTIDQVTSSPVVIFPNPAAGHISIQTQPKDQIRIHTLDGKLVHEAQSRLSLTRIDVASWKPGTYVLTLSNRRGQASAKFQINR